MTVSCKGPITPPSFTKLLKFDSVSRIVFVLSLGKIPQRVVENDETVNVPEEQFLKTEAKKEKGQNNH